MATGFEKSNEWGRYTIEPGEWGFVLDYHTHHMDELDGLRILIPYGAWGFDRDTDLEAAYDDSDSKGEVLADLAMDDADVSLEKRTVRVLAKGTVLH